MANSNYKMQSQAQTERTGGAMRSYIFPDEIPINPEHTLDQLTNRFRAVRDGLPELIKNSKDQYSRLGIVDRIERQIVVIANTVSRTLAVLDFAGAPAENFRGWTTWSDPAAGNANLAADIEAGHGNGGKAFMVRGATATAFLESCYRGRRTRKGFVNDRADKRYKPGFAIEGKVKLDNIREAAPAQRLQMLLASMNLTFDKLPKNAKAAFAKHNAYTAAYIEKVVDWEGRRQSKVHNLARELVPDIIASHGQTAMTIETCEVWVVVDGITLDGPIRPVDLDPYTGFEVPREYEIPDILVDPETGDSINIPRNPSGPRHLRLHTSARQMQISQETRARNVIRVWNSRNNVATWPLQALHSSSAASFIYGELRCALLVGEHLGGADRLHLSDTAVVRALEHWTKERVAELADALHQAMAEDSRPKDREKARAALNEIRELMRRFLEPDSVGDAPSDTNAGTATGGKGKGRGKRRNGQCFGERVDEIELEPGAGDITIISGTGVPLIYRCLERQADGSAKPVKMADVYVESDPVGLVELEPDGTLRALAPGVGRIWLVSSDGRVRSNPKELWIGLASDVSIEIPQTPLLQGQRKKLKITFETLEGPIDDALIEAVIVDPEMGKIGRHGGFTAGMKEGVAAVRVRFGLDQFQEFNLPVGPERVEPPENGRGDLGGDVPEILFCGDEAPGMQEYPKEQRTIQGGPAVPTIIEDPFFPNIVWLNPSSKEAKRVRRSGGGSSGIGRVASKTFLHFVALKCFDILKRLHVRQQIAGDRVTEYQYMQYAVEAEIECADFVDAAWELSDQLLNQMDRIDE